MTNVRPLHDRILVKRIDEEAKTKGGLIIPDTAKEKPMESKVLAVLVAKYTSLAKFIKHHEEPRDRSDCLLLSF